MILRMNTDDVTTKCARGLLLEQDIADECPSQQEQQQGLGLYQKVVPDRIKFYADRPDLALLSDDGWRLAQELGVDGFLRLRVPKIFEQYCTDFISSFGGYVRGVRVELNAATVSESMLLPLGVPRPNYKVRLGIEDDAQVCTGKALMEKIACRRYNGEVVAGEILEAIAKSLQRKEVGWVHGRIRNNVEWTRKDKGAFYLGRWLSALILTSLQEPVEWEETSSSLSSDAQTKLVNQPSAMLTPNPHGNVSSMPNNDTRMQGFSRNGLNEAAAAKGRALDNSGGESLKLEHKQELLMLKQQQQQQPSKVCSTCGIKEAYKRTFDAYKVLKKQKRKDVKRFKKDLQARESEVLSLQDALQSKQGEINALQTRIAEQSQNQQQPAVTLIRRRPWLDKERADGKPINWPIICGDFSTEDECIETYCRFYRLNKDSKDVVVADAAWYCKQLALWLSIKDPHLPSLVINVNMPMDKWQDVGIFLRVRNLHSRDLWEFEKMCERQFLMGTSLAFIDPSLCTERLILAAVYMSGNGKSNKSRYHAAQSQQWKCDYPAIQSKSHASAVDDPVLQQEYSISCFTTRNP